MVNNQNVSSYKNGAPPKGGNANRKITDGPLYPRADVQEVLSKGSDALIAWTSKCTSDLAKWSLDLGDVCELIQIAIERGQYRGSQWCRQNEQGPWAACDSYRVFRKEWIAAANKEMTIEYYIKFAIAKSGKMILTVSCHISEEREG